MTIEMQNGHPETLNVLLVDDQPANLSTYRDVLRGGGENPILVRLKELEVLEKVTDKIDKLTVFGGLEGVLQDVVKINVKSE